MIQHAVSVYDIGLLLCEELYTLQQSRKMCICIQNDIADLRASTAGVKRALGYYEKR